MRRILILGATSSIAHEAARHFAKDGDPLFLAARNPIKLKTVSDDLKNRGASKTGSLQADFDDFGTHSKIIEAARVFLGEIDIALIAHGALGDQKNCENDFKSAEAIFRTNLLSAVSLVTLLANEFERKKKGCIAVISSVAGDRGRSANYVYGSAKSGLTVFLQGLRQRLHPSGISVITIKPGYVDTPMTAHLKRNFLFARPKTVGKSIYRAIVRKKDVLYTPWPWRIIMGIVRIIPEGIFKKTNL